MLRNLALYSFLVLLAGASRLGAATDVGGTLASGTWTEDGGPYHVTEDLVIPPDVILAIEPGVEVLFDRGTSLLIRGTLNALGSGEGKIAFRGSNPGEDWDGVVFSGNAAEGTLEHIEMTGAAQAKAGGNTYPGAFSVAGGANVELRHFHIFDLDVPAVDNGGGSHLEIYDSLVEGTREGIHSSRSFAHVERVTIRNIFGYSDSIDFDYESDPPSVVRNCLIDVNEEDDGIDLGSSNALVEDVTIRGVLAGKAISLDGKTSPIFNRILIYDCERGIVSKDSCTPIFHQVTVTGCDYGVDCYQKVAGKGGGHGTADSMIVWGNIIKQVQLDSLSSFSMTYSIVEGGYEGEGNTDLDPLFVNPEEQDFHLAPDSPAIGAGKDGIRMGALPVAWPPGGSFIRADGNGDGFLDISDAITVLFYLFGGSFPPSCRDALDADDSGEIDLADVIFILSYLYQNGQPPPPPYPGEGTDPTDDDPYQCE